MAVSLELPRRILDEMIAQALAERPQECVGLLAGRPDGLVIERYPLVNALADPCRFESEPRSMFEAEKRRRAAGLEFLAVYHSHPSSPPLPSRRDLECNYSEDVMNLIISLLDPARPEVRAWWLAADGYREASWRLCD